MTDQVCKRCGITELEYEKAKECPKRRDDDGAVILSSVCAAPWAVFAHKFVDDDKVRFR